MLDSRLRLKCDSTRAETRFRLSAKRTSPFKWAGASVQSTTNSRGVRISGSNAGYTMLRGSVRVLATHSIRQFPLYFPSRGSPCAIAFQLDSTLQGIRIIQSNTLFLLLKMNLYMYIYIYIYIYIRSKLQKCCANIYFNKQCLAKKIIPKYVNIKIANTRTSPTAQVTAKKAQITRIKDGLLYKCIFINKNDVLD